MLFFLRLSTIAIGILLLIVWQDLLFAFQVFTFGLGVTAVVLAVRHMLFFRRSGHHLSRSMIAMLVEQVVSALGTMAFSANSLLATLMELPPDEWNSIPPVVAIVIRDVMFGAMIHSTTRLSVSVQKVLHDPNRTN